MGLLAGGVLSGLVGWLASGLTSPIPYRVRLAVILAAGAVAVLRDLNLITLRLPQNARQIPQDVLRSGVVRGPLQFGLELGTGMRTYVSASAPYVLVLAVLLAGQQWPAAVLAGLGFGVGRAASPLIRELSQQGDAWDARLDRRLRLISVSGAVVITVAFGLLLMR